MVALTDYQYQLGASGVLLNSDSLGLPFVDVTKVAGLDSAPFRETIRDREGQDGGFMDAEFETGRELSIEGTVYGIVGNTEPYLDSIKENWGPSTSLVPLYVKLPGVSQRLLFVKPRGVRYDQDTAQRIGCTPIQFLAYAEDPRLYDDNLQSFVAPYGGLATTGFGFNFSFNFSFGASIPLTGVNVINGGNRPTPALITIQGPVVNPRVINDTSGRTLAFYPLTLTVSDTVVIDLDHRTAILNGSTNVRGLMISPDWFLFPKGSTFIRFGGESGSGTATVSLRNAWR